jgi:peptide/nickel transport system permease protein
MAGRTEHADYLIGDDPLGSDEPPSRTASHRARRSLVRDPVFWIGALLVVLVVGSAVLAPLIAPHDPEQQFRREIPMGELSAPPSAMFPLGTDQLGRDYLSLLLYAGRATLFVGLVANTIAVLLGLAVGLVAGYVRSLRMPLPGGYGIGVPVEAGLMRLTDVGLAFPALLLAMALTSAFGRSLTLVTIVIAAVLWTTMARLVYARVLMLRSQEYVTAARALGTGTLGILRRHLLPQVIPLALVYGSLGIATTILFEAGLSFLGAGAPQDSPTWGAMLERQTGSLATDPRLALLPAVAIFVTVLAFNLVGDSLRDAVDPHTQRP